MPQNDQNIPKHHRTCLYLKIDAQLDIEVTTAALRFGHTMIRNQFSRFTPNNDYMYSVNLSSLIFANEEVYK